MSGDRDALRRTGRTTQMLTKASEHLVKGGSAVIIVLSQRDVTMCRGIMMGLYIPVPSRVHYVRFDHRTIDFLRGRYHDDVFIDHRVWEEESESMLDELQDMLIKMPLRPDR